MFKLLSLIALTGCNPNNSNTIECTDHGQCGELQACIDNKCTDVQCLSSTDCELSSYCVGEGPNAFSCKEGCSTNDDCLAGENCNVESNTCEAYGCRSTTLDCPAGQSCDEATGDCFEVDVCKKTCDVYESGCGAGFECAVVSTPKTCKKDIDCADLGEKIGCDMFLTSNQGCYKLADCPEGTDECFGAIQGFLEGECVTSYCHIDYCLPKCMPSDDSCPAGFTCSEGQTGYYCWGDCEYFIDNGYL